MVATRKISAYCIFLLFGLLPANLSSFAQSLELDAEKWAVALSKKDHSIGETVTQLSKALWKEDSLTAFKFLDELAEKGKSKGDHFKAQFNILKAGIIYVKNVAYIYYQDRKSANLDPVKEQMMKLYSSAIDIAYRTEDDLLIAYVSYSFGSVIANLGETGLAVMYAKNGIDLYEKVGYKVSPDFYMFLSELLYKVREYDQSIQYGKKSIAARRGMPNELIRFTVSSMNTVALGYHRQKKYDSAFIYYNQALQLAKQTDDTIWAGIVSGNIGQILYAAGKYDSAYTLLKRDYQASKEHRFYDNAANSLQWAARTNLARGNKPAALAEVREAFQLLKVWPDANYLRNAYFTATQIFKEMNNYDSAFYYNNLYSTINDSLEKVIATSSLAISKAKLNYETSRYNIQALNKEKRSQLLFRNIIIAGIILLSIIALLMLNRKRLTTKMRMEKIEQEKLMMEREILSAKQQLEMFTANIVEKTNLIEKLEQQVRTHETSEQQDQLIQELSQQTILTEDDWIRFKSLFEKIHPGFFSKLKEKASDITVAEQRMAALVRLQLTVRQMASILGISTDSVHKTRQRLRQRLHILSEASLENSMAII